MRFLPALYITVTALTLTSPTLVWGDSNLSYIKTQKATSAEAQEKPMGETAQNVWDKYKALLQGTESEESSKKAKTIAVKPIKEIKTPSTTKTQAQTKTAPATAGTIANILETYQSTKKSNNQMHTLTIRKAEPTENMAEDTKE